MLFAALTFATPAKAQMLDPVKELKAYYEQQDKAPAFEAAIEKLASGDAKQREQATAWLTELLSQSLKDETSGAAPWRATPFWGSSGENPARNLRTSIARALAEAKQVPAGALPVLRWYFDEEFLPALQHDAMAALNKLTTSDAVALRAELAMKPHANLVVVADVLKVMVERKEKLPMEPLGALCQHHRASIREPARKLQKQQGGAEPAAFDPANAILSPALRKLLKEMDALILDAPAADAPWIVASFVVYDSEKKAKKSTFDQSGWLVKDQGDKVEIFTPFGWHETVRKSDTPTRDSERENWWTCTIARGTIEDEVARVEKIRKEGDKDFEFSERGALTGQFQGSGAGLFELILAQRLHAAGKAELAARVLLPALETLYRDDAIVDILRRDLGKNYGYQMLVAFAGDRDYDRTEKLAKTLAEHFPETIFHHYAVRLADEIPKRRDDFVKHKLPTPAEWAEMKKKMTREEQIDFLAQRYRLLNYFQAMQPGGYFPGSTQYAEACGMKRNASWGLSKGKTEVINPEVELTGVRGWGDDEKQRGLALTLKDVPALSKHLRDDWLMPTVTFWRDFSPSRSLSSTRPSFAGIINGLASRDLCKIEGWDKLKPAEINKEVERINNWARANAHKTPIQLEWEVVDEELAAGAGWRDLRGRLEWLLKKKELRVYDVMRRILENEKTDAYEKSQILQAFLNHDVTEAKDVAHPYLDHKDLYVRFKAAVIVFQTGDKAKARPVLGEGLESWGLDWWAKHAVEILLNDGTDESRKQAARIFKLKELDRTGGGVDNYRAEIMHLCAEAGLKEPYHHYLKQLDNNDVGYISWGANDEKVTQTTYAQIHAREIINTLAAKDATVQEIAKKYKTESEQIPHLKKWLEAKVAAK
jgi:hypothetical protein